MSTSERGFTLVELIITLSIAGILVAAAVPAFTATIRNNRLSAQTNEFVYALRTARSEAIKRSTPVTVCRSSNQTSCTTTGTASWENGWIAFTEVGGANGAFDAGEVLLLSHEAITARNTLRGNNNVTNSVSFNAQGMVQAGNGTFVLCDSRGNGSPTNTLALAESREIVVAFTGQTRLVTPNSRRATNPVTPNPTTCTP